MKLIGALSTRVNADIERSEPEELEVEEDIVKKTVSRFTTVESSGILPGLLRLGLDALRAIRKDPNAPREDSVKAYAKRIIADDRERYPQQQRHWMLRYLSGITIDPSVVCNTGKSVNLG